MISIRLFVLINIFFFFTYCTSNLHSTEAEVVALHDQLMALHDTTMTQYGESGNLAEQLKKMTSQEDTTMITPIDSIRTELDASNEYMMDWMNNYHEPETKDSAALGYLHQQIELLKKLDIHQKQNIHLARLILTQPHHQ